VLGLVAPSGFEVDTLQEWRRRSKEGKEKVSRRRQKSVKGGRSKRASQKIARESLAAAVCALSFDLPQKPFKTGTLVPI
jgi:hypothetical protein